MIVHIQKTVFLSLILFTINCGSVFSQDDPYQAEIGLQTGINLYAGDVNSIGSKGLFMNNLQNIKPDVGAMFRYRFNPRLALRFGYDFTTVKGKYQYASGSLTNSAALNNPLHVIDLWGEFNFFDLNNNPYKRFSKRYSPFIFAGFGGMFMPQYQNTENRNFTFILPFGVGFKVKIAQRWNFNVLWTNRLLLGDNLEGKAEFDNPAPKTGFNPMNNDLLSGVSLGVSFDFWERKCDCNNTSSSAKPALQKPVKQKTPKEKKK